MRKFLMMLVALICICSCSDEDDFIENDIFLTIRPEISQRVDSIEAYGPFALIVQRETSDGDIDYCCGLFSKEVTLGLIPAGVYNIKIYTGEFSKYYTYFPDLKYVNQIYFDLSENNKNGYEYDLIKDIFNQKNIGFEGEIKQFRLTESKEIKILLN